mgnify:CR=1 FL=1
MKLFFILFLSLSINLANSANNVTERSFYGTDFKTENFIAMEKIVTQFDNYKDKEVVLKAKAEKVCAKKGCWMSMKLKNKSVRVKFKDYGFFVPMSLEKKDIYVKGIMTREKVSIKDTRHYLEDAGASKKEISAVTKPSYEFHFTASGVKLL